MDKVITYVLCEQRQFIVNAAAIYQYLAVGKMLEGVGPHITSLRVYALGKDFGPGFKYKVTGEHSYDGITWTAFAADAMTENTADGNWVGNVYSTTTDFGPNLRFKIGVYGTTVGTGGTLSALVALTFAS